MNASPFHPGNHASKPKTLLDTFRDVFKSEIIGRIPSETVKQMPEKYMIFFGSILHLCLLGLFLYLFSSGFISAVNRSVLSPATQRTSDCETVLISNTGTYFADNQGRWEGQTNFSYSLSLYSVSVVSLIVSPEIYAEAMNNLYNDLVIDGGRAKENNLGYNILLWTSLVILMNSNNIGQKMEMASDPLVIFNRQYNLASIAGVTGRCSASSQASFDSSTGIFSAIFDYSQYKSDENCYSLIDPELLGYLKPINENWITIKYDIISLVTSVAVNYGILGTYELQAVSGLDVTFNYSGISYPTVSYVDPRYPNMAPVYCIQLGDETVCAFLYGSVYAIPILEHRGNSPSAPEWCDCQHLNTDDMSAFSQCNLFQFIHGFILWNTTDPTPLFELYMKYTPFNLSKVAFNASFASSYWGMTTGNEYYRSPQFLRESFEFCNIPGYGYCVMILFSSFDMNQTSRAVSRYQYQLFEGSCSDSISIPYSKFSNLIVNPPVSLVQSYVICNTTTSQAFLSALGIAMGNVTTFTPILVLFMVGVVFLTAKLFSIKIPQTYSRKTKNDAMDALATSLLLVRDEKLSNLEKQDVLKQIVTALELHESVDIYHVDPYESHINWKEATNASKLSVLNPLRSPSKAVELTAASNSLSQSITTTAVNAPSDVSHMSEMTNPTEESEATIFSSSSTSTTNDICIINSECPTREPPTFNTARDIELFLQNLVSKLNASTSSSTSIVSNSRIFWERIMDVGFLTLVSDPIVSFLFRNRKNSHPAFETEVENSVIVLLQSLSKVHLRFVMGISDASSRNLVSKRYGIQIGSRVLSYYQIDQLVEDLEE